MVKYFQDLHPLMFYQIHMLLFLHNMHFELVLYGLYNELTQHEKQYPNMDKKAQKLSSLRAGYKSFKKRNPDERE